jgi:hypothetical protein
MNRILAEQRRCRDYIAEHPDEDHSRGASLGLAGWVMEEVLMRYDELKKPAYEN